MLIVIATLRALRSPPTAMPNATAIIPQRMPMALITITSATIFGVSFNPRAKLTAPRTRHRERAKVAEAVEAILGETTTEGEIEVTIEERTEETFRQQRRGRPTAETLYVRSERKRFELTCRVESARLAEAARCDGIFPLISNVDALISFRRWRSSSRDIP